MTTIFGFYGSVSREHKRFYRYRTFQMYYDTLIEGALAREVSLSLQLRHARTDFLIEREVVETAYMLLKMSPMGLKTTRMGAWSKSERLFAIGLVDRERCLLWVEHFRVGDCDRKPPGRICQVAIFGADVGGLKSKGKICY